jgi:hypothetical protein
VDCSAVILEHLLNSFYNLSNIKLENIECLMLMHASQKYECGKTRDFCVRQLRKGFEQPDSTTALIGLDIVARYCKVSCIARHGAKSPLYLIIIFIQIFIVQEKSEYLGIFF